MTAFRAMTAAVIVMLLASNLPTPLYPVYEHAFSLSPLGVTLVYATYAVVVLVCLPLTGSLSDAIGRRRVILAAVGLSSVSAVLFALARGAAWLIAAQVVEGTAMAALQGTAVPALLELEPHGDVTRAARIGSTATVGGGALGPLLTGVLAQYGPQPRRLSYVVTTVMLLAVGLALVRQLPPDHGTGARWGPRWPTFPTDRRPFILASATSFCVWAVAALFLSLAPSYVIASAHTRNLAILGGAASAMLATSAAVQMFGSRGSAARSQVIGLFFASVAAVLLAEVTVAHSVSVLLASGVFAGAGLGLGFRGALAAASGAAPEERRGAALSAFYVVVYLGASMPVVGVGILAQHVGLVQAVKLFGWTAAAAAAAVNVAHLRD